MKKFMFLFLMMATGCMLVAQTATLKPGLSFEQLRSPRSYFTEPLQHEGVSQSRIKKPAVDYKSTDAVSVIDLGTSADAWSLGPTLNSCLTVNNDIHAISFIHAMGGSLDPMGSGNDLGIDISLDGGLAWSVMNKIYTAVQNSGGQHYTDGVLLPNNGIYNPIGNTDPGNAHVVYFAPTWAGSSGPLGGLCWGRGSIDDPSDTTYNFINTNPATGIFHFWGGGFTVTKTGDFWGVDENYDWNNYIYKGNLVLTHGVWNTALMDYEPTFSLLDLTGPVYEPLGLKIGFSPDGQIGYVAAIMDIGKVPVSSGKSYYPVLFRTEDAGLTWSDPIPVALAGADGMPGIHNFLSDAEIAEIYEPPLPGREEIPFTTSLNINISVDHHGNPHIAVLIGVTGSEPYSIIRDRSAESGYLYMASFLLSSDNKGNEGSWTAHMMGRISNYESEMGGKTQLNLVQIARDKLGKKMFVGWNDTDTSVSYQNNAPDIWCRGYDVEREELTMNEDGLDMPNNVTFGSDATYSAFFFRMANEVFDDGLGTYTIPFVYEIESGDIDSPVQYKYIQDFSFLMSVGIDEPMVQSANMEVSQVMPNPATATARLSISLNEPASVSGKITNMMGQQVSTLPVRRLQACSNELVLDVSSLSAGIYFCTLTTGTETVTRKMIVE